MLLSLHVGWRPRSWSAAKRSGLESLQTLPFGHRDRPDENLRGTPHHHFPGNPPRSSLPRTSLKINYTTKDPDG